MIENHADLLATIKRIAALTEGLAERHQLAARAAAEGELGNSGECIAGILRAAHQVATGLSSVLGTDVLGAGEAIRESASAAQAALVARMEADTALAKALIVMTESVGHMEAASKRTVGPQ